MLAMLTYAVRSAYAAIFAVCAMSTATVGLQQQIESIVASRSYTDDQISVAVRDCTTGTLIVDINADHIRIPASNMKVLTTGTAALVLGAEFRFETRLLRRGDTLILQGDGDPALGDPRLLARMDDLAPEQLLDVWASAVEQSGMRSVKTLIVDDRVFDRESTPPQWPENQFERRHSAPVSGLNFHRNTTIISAKGTRDRVQVRPMTPRYPGIDLVNSITLDTRQTKSAALDPVRQLDANRIVLKGKVSPGKSAGVEISIDAPAIRTGQLLASLLRQRGIVVDQVRLADPDDPPAAGTPMGPPIVTPIATVLDICNAYSTNLYAESLLKRLAHQTTGRPGTRTDGGRIVTRTAQQLTGNAQGLHVEDGSGLSRGNQVSARLLAAFLCAFDGDTADETVFLESLATPGEGTLKGRLAKAAATGALVQAKSGYINRVSALSGLVTRSDERRLAFSIMVNNTDRTKPARGMQDAIVAAIASSVSQQTTSFFDRPMANHILVEQSTNGAPQYRVHEHGINLGQTDQHKGAFVHPWMRQRQAG